MTTLTAALLAAAAAAAAEKPNLLILHTDEHNVRTLGCYRALLPREQAFIWGGGVKVDTPNLDSIAAAGAVCDRFYTASPVCTPSRASFVSGRYPQNTGAIHNDLPMRDEIVTFAEVLRRRGYATGYAGKWHLDGPAKPGWAPARTFGFEDNRFMFNRGHWKQLETGPGGPRVKAVNARGQPTYAVEGADKTSFTTDFLADRALDFIRAHKDGPFCYMVSFPDPHGPNSVRPPYDTMFSGLAFQAPATARAQGEGLPSWGRTLPDTFSAPQMARYFGMVKCIDDNVGRILAGLKAAGILDRTIVVFTADHGDMCGEHGRHNKGIPLESSARIPFLIHAPGAIKPGTVVREALTTVDFKPTILALMGAPGDAADEGRDASALFRTGRAPAGWKDLAFSRIGTAPGGWFAALSRRHKLVVSPGDAPCLFDLERDPDELRNVFLSPDYRETVRAMGAALRDYAKARREPLAENAAVRADLAWAAEGTGAYEPPPRPPAAGRKAKKAADDEE